MTEKIEQLYLEDLNVGQRFTSGSHTIEAARMEEFAAESDPQPFHLEEAAAEVSIFKRIGGERLAHSSGSYPSPCYRWSAIRERHRWLRGRNRVA